ncbi:MAG: S-layer homology domain-containing protein [Bacillota bacterium]
MKFTVKKAVALAMAGVMTQGMTALAFANQMVGVDLWNAVSDKASMGNVATDNNEFALYNEDTNTLQIAFNPVNISGYISGVTQMQYDTTGNGNFKDVTVIERASVESGTRNDGNSYTVDYIQIMEFDVPSYLKKSGVEYIDLQMKVPHTPMDSVIADGYLDARLRIDWSDVSTTDLTKIVADDTMSGGEIATVSLQDQTSGIRVIGDSTQVTSDADLYVAQITSGADYEKAKTALGVSDFDLYDVRFAVGGTEVGMMGAAELRVPYTGELEIYRISDEGNKTLLRGAAAVTEYSFLTNQVGLIAIVGGEKQAITLVDGATNLGGLYAETPTTETTTTETTTTETTTTESTTTSSNPFTDISSHWAKDNILYAVEQGLFSGTSATTFSPDANMTGGMVISVLHRIAGSPETATTDSSWYGQAVAWGKNNGIIGGYKTFDPSANVTREEFATMLYLFEKMSNDTVAGADLSKFSDSNQISSWAYEGLAWSNQVGIVAGSSATTISPQNDASRAVIATMLCRYIDMQ